VTGLILDASVCASWFIDDEIDERTERVMREIQTGAPVFAPSLWLLEITNALFNAERRRRIDKKKRQVAFEEVGRLPVTLLAPPTLADLRTLCHFVERHQLTAYDAEYLRVAKELRLPLATFDQNLVDAARREKVRIFGGTE
jgi:predicted nucleic acid-binding protein